MAKTKEQAAEAVVEEVQEEVVTDEALVEPEAPTVAEVPHGSSMPGVAAPSNR